VLTGIRRTLVRVVGRVIVVSVREDAIGLTFGIVELVVPKRPEKGEQADPAENQRHGDEDGEDVHVRRPSRIALSETMIELKDIAMAATSGVTKPA